MGKTEIIDDCERAARALRQGAIVAFPTETVYGLAVDATNSSAVKRLFAAKGRPADNPLIVHLTSKDEWPLAASHMTQSATLLLEQFSPGPLTVVVPKRSEISPLVTAELDSVGIRIPDHAIARRLLELCQIPIAAPSANRSGRPSCTTWQSVLEDLDGRIDYIVPGEVCDVGIESTVVDCTTDLPVILRFGKISAEAIQRIFPQVAVANQQTELSERLKTSPGTRHPHYQPQARVVLFESMSQLTELDIAKSDKSAIVTFQLDGSRKTDVNWNRFGLVRHFSAVDDYAREFYEVLRQTDRLELKVIYLQLADMQGLGTALRDRQLRAAGYVEK